MLRICSILFLLFFVAIVPAKVFATAPIIISSSVDSLNLDTSFTVTATMSGLSKSSVYRMRLALAQPATSNYFGSTYNGTSWYNGTPSPISYSSFLTITTDGNGAWGGDIQGKIDADDPNFTTGSGTYDLKIGRYTQTGSTATWSDSKSVIVVVPPTPTPTNTPTPTPTATPTPKPATPTPTKGVSSQSSKEGGPTLSPGKSSVSSDSAGEKDADSDILGASDSASPVPTQSKDDSGAVVLGSSTSPVPFLFIALGLIFFAACGILAYFKFGDKIFIWKKDRNL